MSRIVWTAPAVEDLQSIHSYIARDSEFYADAVLQRIFEAVDRLEQLPLSGRAVPELDDEKTREVIVQPYRIIYDTSAETVRVLTVLHSARSFPGTGPPGLVD